MSHDFYNPGRGGDGIWFAAWDRMEDIHQICPQTALVSTQKQSDYSLLMRWDKDHWSAILDSDDQLLLNETTPDFNKVVRDTCMAIRKNEDWPVRPTHFAETKNILLDRYELHDVRNGNVVTSALLDKQTGKVWIRSTGKSGSAFMAEDVLPPPDSH